MTLVVDASVAIKLYVDEADSQRARRVLAGPEPLLAPALILAEVGNVVWRLARRGELSDDQVTSIPQELPLLFDELVPLQDLFVEIVRLARDLDYPVYDCFYLVLAQERGAPLWSRPTNGSWRAWPAGGMRLWCVRYSPASRPSSVKSGK